MRPARDLRPTWWTVAVLGVALVAAVLLTRGGPDTFAGAAPDELADVQRGWSEADVPLDAAALDALPRLDADPGAAITPPGTVLLNVWASSCGPCADELPLLARLDRDPAVAVVGLSRDVAAAPARRSMSEAGVTYPTAIDPTEGFVEGLRDIAPVQRIPVSLLVEDGTITWVHVGAFDSYDALRAEVTTRTA